MVLLRRALAALALGLLEEGGEDAALVARCAYGLKEGRGY
jgi:hypothetical protein